MAVTFDASSSQDLGGGTTSWSHVVASTGGNNVLYVWVLDSGQIAESTTGVTFNGVAMTKLTAATYNSGSYVNDTLWELVAPTAGSNTVSVSGGSGRFAGAVSLQNVNQTTPSVTVAEFDNAASPNSKATAGTLTGEVVLSLLMLVGGGTSPVATGTSQTSRMTAGPSTSSSDELAASTTTGNGASRTTSWTWTGVTNRAIQQTLRVKNTDFVAPSAAGKIPLLGMG